ALAGGGAVARRDQESAFHEGGGQGGAAAQAGRHRGLEPPCSWPGGRASHRADSGGPEPGSRPGTVPRGPRDCHSFHRQAEGVEDMTVQPVPAGLCTIQGAPVPLEEVEIRAQLRDLLVEVTVAQAYRNAETVPIEAVYTFPLPLEAVLLDVEVKLDDRALHGRVVERVAAERAYEAAIDAGDAAIM